MDVSGEIRRLTPTLQISADDVPVPDDANHLSPAALFPLRQQFRMMKVRSGGGPPQNDESSDESNLDNRFGDATPETPEGTQPSHLPLSRATSSIQRIVNALIGKGATIPKSKVILKQGGVMNQLKMPITCLHTAVESGDIELIQILLKNGACFLTWNESGETAIHLAVVKRLMEPLRVLLEWGKSAAVADARDSQGRTPLHLAVAEEWAPGVSILLEAGADVKATSNDNQTVLHLAATQDNPKLLEELLSIPESAKVILKLNLSFVELYHYFLLTFLLIIPSKHAHIAPHILCVKTV